MEVAHDWTNAPIESLKDPPMAPGSQVMGATDRLFERHPDAQPWGIRIGHHAVYHLRSRSLKTFSEAYRR